MPQERQVIGYMPDGTAILGGPVQVQSLMSDVNLGSLGTRERPQAATVAPPVASEPTQRPTGAVASALDAWVKGEGILGSLRAGLRGGIESDINTAQSLYGAAKQGAGYVADAVSEVPSLTLPKAGRVLESLASGFSGSDGEVFKGEDSKLASLAAGAGLMAGMATPDPTDAARVAKAAQQLVPQGSKHGAGVWSAIRNMEGRLKQEAAALSPDELTQRQAVWDAANSPKFKLDRKAGVESILDAKQTAQLNKVRAANFSSSALPANAKPKAVHDAIVANGGVSVHPSGLTVPYKEQGPSMSGVFPNQSGRTFAIPLSQFQPRHVSNFWVKNRDQFQKNQWAHIGGWVEKKDGVDMVYLDVSTPFEDVRQATKFAELQNPGVVRGKLTGVVRDPQTGEWPKAQKAVYHAGTGESPPVANFYEFIQSPEIRTRLDEMAEIGKAAMTEEGGTNWWPIISGPLERVYGKDKIETVAGMLAATSPQNAPRPNMRMASELIRRVLKGEPVNQPNWRAPATAMGEGFSPKAGAAMPAPGTWSANATRVAEGQPETVQQDKVNDMFHALMGKDVGVYDRHWAKVMEDPARGAYAEEVANKIAGSMDTKQASAYAAIDNVVRDAAKRAGVSTSDYSAWVWEGIRTTIAETGQLYGQTHRAKSIPTGRSGFNNVFEELVKEKAAHLGVTVQELEKRLRNGDAELLGVLLSTLTGGALATGALSHSDASPTPGKGGA